MTTKGRQVDYPEYEDFLDLLRKKGEFNFIRQHRNFPVGSKVGCSPKARSTSQINEDVLGSPRVKNTITEEAIRRGCSVEEVRREARDILSEMAHTYNLTNVRAFGYAVCKIMERIFDGIYVNDAEMRRIREISRNDPVVFMPSHKTYFDFLLLSLLCFHYEIQLPAIAAGQDFMSMKFMGEVLRRSGAFFMRRSFGDDQLYWAVFSEYVQTHVVNNDRTVEFFVEATRSRVGKSLHPKYGLLQILLEPYLRGSVFDMVIVPVSMNYDKILEEKLYAYELLGFPKPKESTSGLLKAREILNKKSGSVFLTFGEPISVRKFFGTTLHRNTFVCQPDSQFVLDDQAKREIKKFAHHVVEKHNENSVINVWSLASMVMLQALDIDDLATFEYRVVALQVHELLKLLNKLGTVVNIQKSLDHDLRYYLQVHDDLFEPFDVTSPNFELCLIDYPVEQSRVDIPNEIMRRAVSRLILTTYSNGMIHAIDSEAILCAIILNFGHVNRDNIFNEFRWMHNLMKREFVTVPGEVDKLFVDTLEILRRAEIVKFEGRNITIERIADAAQLVRYITPYFIHFDSVYASFDPSRKLYKNVQEFVPIAQKHISDIYTNRESFARLSFLSTEPIKNAFQALLDWGALVKSPDGLLVKFDKIKEVRQKLARFTNFSTGASKL